MANTLGITIDQVQTRADEDFDTADRRGIESRIDQAVRLLLGRPGGRALLGHVASGAVELDTVIDVVWRAVSRTLEATGPYKTEAEGEYRYEVDPKVASGDLWFTREDLALLTPAGEGTAPRTARVRPSSGWAGW